ncbi:MAG TPA: cytochrome c oxidase subunit II [Phototrophicaceae bacterium]|jgi:cytochrome c oxidase subunit 2|nr:cytochrome c oxidase subunit II [Phototrophicaceae bacterium]
MDLSQKNNKGVQISIPAVFIAGAAIIAGGFIIGMATPSLFPVVASAQAEQVDGLFRVLLTIGGAIFLLVQGLLLYSIIRFRAQPGDMSDGPNIHGHVALEVVWTTIPAIIVFGLAIYSWQIWSTTRAEIDNEMVVNVTAQRYAWGFTYTDPLNRLADQPIEKQQFNSNVLYTFVGQPMLLKIHAIDVNHAFWIPTMRIKQDALVGRETEVRFTPIRAGRYRVQCAELCGGGHGGMFTYVVVYENEQEFYHEFADIQVYNIQHPPTDPVSIGQNLLSSGVYPCSGCHTLAALNWTGVTGPNLNGIGSRAADRAVSAGDPSGEFYIAQSLRAPNSYTVPGFSKNVMPQFGGAEAEPAVVDGAYYRYLPDADLVGIVAYLCSQTTSGEIADTSCGDTQAIQAAVTAQSQ